MKYKFALLISITLLLIINGCSSQPSLLHQRTSTDSPGEEIWIMDDNGKNAQLIIKGTLPQWIWGGRSHIAYFVPGKPCDPSTAAICGTIYIADWDQNTQSIIGTPKAISGPDSGEHFAWSRDGQWIVFESFRDGNWEIYKIRRDGMGATNLTNNPSMDIEPDWTQDGSKNGTRSRLFQIELKIKIFSS